MMHPIKKGSLETPTERLSGSVERVTFYSEESGYCVLRVKVRGQRDLVTVVGTVAEKDGKKIITATKVEFK